MAKSDDGDRITVWRRNLGLPDSDDPWGLASFEFSGWSNPFPAEHPLHQQWKDGWHTLVLRVWEARAHFQAIRLDTWDDWVKAIIDNAQRCLDMMAEWMLPFVGPHKKALADYGQKLAYIWEESISVSVDLTGDTGGPSIASGVAAMLGAPPEALASFNKRLCLDLLQAGERRHAYWMAEAMRHQQRLHQQQRLQGGDAACPAGDGANGSADADQAGGANQSEASVPSQPPDEQILTTTDHEPEEQVQLLSEPTRCPGSPKSREERAKQRRSWVAKYIATHPKRKNGNKMTHAAIYEHLKIDKSHFYAWLRGEGRRRELSHFLLSNQRI